MSRNRSHHPSDQQHGSTPEKKTSNKRASNQSSGEMNRNEERITPSGGTTRASQQWNQMSQDRDRATGRTTPLTERPDIASSQWNQQTERNQSKLTGTQMQDKTNPNAEQWKQTSKDDYPTAKKSSPTPESQVPDQQYVGTNQERRKDYTGNSERSGQQYSIDGNSSERAEKNLKTGHPANDRQRTHEKQELKRPVSANKGTDQQRSEATQQRQKSLNRNADEAMKKE